MASGSFSVRIVIAQCLVRNVMNSLDCHMGIYGISKMAGAGIRVYQLAESLMEVLLFKSGKVVINTK